MRPSQRNKLLFFFALSGSLVFGQKQVGLNINIGPSIISPQYRVRPDSVSLSIGASADIGISYRIYINKRWGINVSGNYGRYSGQENFAFETIKSPLTPLPPGSKKGYKRWWFYNWNWQIKTNYNFENGLGLNFGIRVVNSIFRSGKRYTEHYRSDGEHWNTTEVFFRELDYNRINIGPTVGIHYKNNGEFYFYLFYYHGLNNLKDYEPQLGEPWKLRQIIAGVNIPLI